MTYKGNHFKICPSTSAIICAPQTGEVPQEDDWSFVDLDLLSDEDVQFLAENLQPTHTKN